MAKLKKWYSKSLPMLWVSLFPACAMTTGNGLADNEKGIDRQMVNRTRYLMDNEMAKVFGGMNTLKCCEGQPAPLTDVACSDSGTCNEAVWGCKKIGDWCSMQFYLNYSKCKDDPQHPSRKCGTHFGTVHCVYKARDLAPPDGNCNYFDGHCITMVDPPCGTKWDCVDGSDYCG